jgi:phosphomannomutase
VKKLVVFDLDGTLAESKSAIDAEMAKLLDSLLDLVKVSVISGGAWLQFEKQVLRDVLKIPIPEMIFVGDAVFPGGNDYPAKEAGALSIEVRDPHETKRVIEAISACLGDG